MSAVFEPIYVVVTPTPAVVVQSAVPQPVNVAVTVNAPNVGLSTPLPVSVAYAASQGLAGPPGTQGPQGVPGPQGPPGSTGSTFTYIQASPSNTWHIAHNLGRYPSVTVVDSSGDVVEGDVDYVDANTLVATFNAPFAGDAYLN